MTQPSPIAAQAEVLNLAFSDGVLGNFCEVVPRHVRFYPLLLDKVSAALHGNAPGSDLEGTQDAEARTLSDSQRLKHADDGTDLRL